MVKRLRKLILPDDELRSLAQQFRCIDNTNYFKVCSEGAFEKDLQGILGEAGVIAIKVPDKISELVMPDLLCHFVTQDNVMQTFYIECKGKGKKASPRQKSAFPLLGEYVNIFLINDWLKVADLFDALGGVLCWPPTSLRVNS
ncbi:hypothetical protein [Sulfurimonas sp.]|uniref:hypothetical protein n=1 Tax=Sulfurimonas sp. TaxID=2022749 RepID=UPI0035641570